ncbi:MAG TPA: glycosyltransferase family 1 protein, partial [Gemmatimonadaceae bacterium]|nr:glycosyltransferase family 1 protein [Gemmatimonadaceae bacterium]
ADRVICVSEASADDVVRLGGVPAERVRVIPNAVDDRFAGPAPLAPVVPGPYVLFVGTPEPRKNLPRLFEAVRRRRGAGAPEQLVLAGGQGWGNVRLANALVLGEVDDETLHALYAHASCLVLPSLHEGFGIPVVEAMAAGCPVVASRVGGLPEVCGDAAVLVDPYDPDDIARGIDDAIRGADRLRERGRRRAERYSWDAVAEQTVAVYRELV